MSNPLKTYLDAVGVSRHEFAKESGIRYAAVHEWCRSGPRTTKAMLRIEKATKQAVPVEVWASFMRREAS